MRQDTIPIEQIIELYSIRGHQVTTMIERSENIVDLIIRSKQGQTWVARYAHVDVIDAAIMRGVFAVKQMEDAATIALITDGAVSAEARQMADGVAVYLANQEEFDKYLSRARKQAYKGVPGFVRRIRRTIARWVSPDRGTYPPIPYYTKYDVATQVQDVHQPVGIPSEYSANQPGRSSVAAIPSALVTGRTAPTPSGDFMGDYQRAAPQSPTTQPQAMSYVEQTVPKQSAEKPAAKNTCPHGVGLRENCAICLGQREYEFRFGDWQSD